MNLPTETSEEPAKKVMIITYYWPPSGGSGVQRWLKFVKYLPSFGWEPYVFTPENPTFALRDDSLLKDVPPEAEVIRLPIWEPYDFYLKMSKRKARPAEIMGSSRRSLFQRISIWIRGNVLIPDPKVFWVRPAVSFLSSFLREAGVQTIITTGPPHSMHLIGYRLKKKNPALKWIADFRDPWSQWGFLDSLRSGSWSRSIHRSLEKKVLQSADRILTITPFYVNQFSRLANRKATLLTNGFDEQDFAGMKYIAPPKFTIRHIGTVNEKCDPRPFLMALRAFVTENPVTSSELILEFVGDVHPDVREFITTDATLAKVTVFSVAVPHDQLISIYGNTSLLLLILHGYRDAEGYMPGKLFEYIATGIPVLGVGPASGDAAALLRETKSGIMVEAADERSIQNALQENFRLWQQEGQRVSKSSNVDQYSRRSLTARLVEML